jgi:hypothetical protein
VAKALFPRGVIVGGVSVCGDDLDVRDTSGVRIGLCLRARVDEQLATAGRRGAAHAMFAFHHLEFVGGDVLILVGALDPFVARLCLENQASELLEREMLPERSLVVSAREPERAGSTPSFDR